MKPCYRRDGLLYLLARLTKEGSEFQQPCKACISPGNCPAVTRVAGEFLRRCGWLASKAAPPELGSEITIVDSADSTGETAQLVHCKLVVGSCQLSTVLQVVEDVEFPDQHVLSKWQIHIGEKDFETLQCNAWDSDICYLSANPEKGQLGSHPDCPLSCSSFMDALENGHPDCLSFWNIVMHHQGKKGWRPYHCEAATGMLTAEALLYVHDVLGVPWDTLTTERAAAAGSIDCLSYAHACGCPWKTGTCAMAAAAGNLHCLAYGHEHGCEWNRVTLEKAACNGHLECLKYAHTHGCLYIVKWPVSFLWTDAPIYLTLQACFSSSEPCLVYVREVMGCAWDPKGSECKLAFDRGNLVLLQYIHSHGGVLCTQFELLCPYSEIWLRDSGPDADKKAASLLYVHCYGGCRVKGIWHTKVGSLVREILDARRLAVLLSFHAAGRVHVGGPLVAAAHAAMHSLPNDVVQDIICAAGLQNPE